MRGAGARGGKLPVVPEDYRAKSLNFLINSLLQINGKCSWGSGSLSQVLDIPLLNPYWKAMECTGTPKPDSSVDFLKPYWKSAENAPRAPWTKSMTFLWNPYQKSMRNAPSTIGELGTLKNGNLQNENFCGIPAIQLLWGVPTIDTYAYVCHMFNLSFV